MRSISMLLRVQSLELILAKLPNTSPTSGTIYFRIPDIEHDLVTDSSDDVFDPGMRKA
jgi:hypothetical protein